MAKKPAKGKIPGQGQPIDAQMDLFWRDNRNFAEVFNKRFLMDSSSIPMSLKM